MFQATLLGLFTAPEAGAEMQAHQCLRAVPGKGLAGDRYFHHAGSFSRWPGPHRDVTLIAIEDLHWLAETHGLTLEPRLYRRNLLTQGVVLETLLNQKFQIGNVWLRGERWCQPCKYLARMLAVPDLVQLASRRTGIRARVLTEGEIAVGDEVVLDHALDHAREAD